MKKLVSVLLALILMVSMVSVIAACGVKKGVPNFEVPEGGYDGSEVTITFYHTMSKDLLQPVLNSAIEEFNKIYPKIHVEHSYIGSYDSVRDQVKTEIANQGGPNIAYCYPDHVAMYMPTGRVAALDNLIDSTIEVTRADGTKEVLGLTKDQIADFIPGYYEEGRQFGDQLMYTMPFSKSTEVLYYNKTFFAANDIKVPTHWFSTNDSDETSMEYVCKKIKSIAGDKVIPLGYDSDANWFITMCEQYGYDYTSATGDHYLFNNKGNRELWAKLREWYVNGYVTTQSLNGGYTSSLFVAQNSYMSIGSSAGATHQRPNKDAATDSYPFDVGIAPIPQANSSKPKAISQGPSVCIFKKDNAQEVVASWLFVKYLTTNVAFQAEFADVSGYIPVIKSVNTDADFAAKLNAANGGDNIAYLSMKVCLEAADSYYTSPAFDGSSTARDQVGALVSKIFSAQTDNVSKMIEDAFKAAIEECEYVG